VNASGKSVVTSIYDAIDRAVQAILTRVAAGVNGSCDRTVGATSPCSQSDQQ